MAGRLGEEALHQFQAERRSGADEFGIVVAGVGGAATREGVAEGVHGFVLQGRAAGRRESDREGEQQELENTRIHRSGPARRRA